MCKVHVCEANAIFTGQRTSKSSIVKESTTRDVVREKKRRHSWKRRWVFNAVLITFMLAFHRPWPCRFFAQKVRLRLPCSSFPYTHWPIYKLDSARVMFQYGSHGQSLLTSGEGKHGVLCKHTKETHFQFGAVQMLNTLVVWFNAY